MPDYPPKKSYEPARKSYDSKISNNNDDNNLVDECFKLQMVEIYMSNINANHCRK